MTKKIIALLMAVMMLSVSAFAFAEAEVPAIQYDEAAMENVEGDWYDLTENYGIAFEYFVPAALIQQDVTDEMAAQGIIDVYMTEDQSCNMTFGLVTPQAALSSMDEVAAAYVNIGYKAQVVTVNEAPAVLYENAEQDVQGVVFMLEDGRLLSVNFVPASSEEYTLVAELIISSMGFFDPAAEEEAE